MIIDFESSGWNCSILSRLQSRGLVGGEFSASKLDKHLALFSVCLLIKEIWPHKNCFFISGHDAWQPNSRIANYKKFWSLSGIERRPKEGVEWGVANDNRVKYYGVAPIKNNEWLLRCEMLEWCTSWVIVVDEHIGVDEIKVALSNGWECLPGGNIPDAILDCAVNCAAFFLRFFGPMDNGEQGVIVIGDRGGIKCLKNRSKNIDQKI